MSTEELLGGAVKDERPLAVRVQEAYEAGANDIEIMEIMKLTPGKFREVYENNPNFRDAVDLGRVMSQAWWLKTGRKNLSNKTFNTSLWAFNMKNRFGWAEKTDNTNQDTTELTTEQMADKLHKMLPEVSSRLFPEKTGAQILTMLKTDGTKQ